MNSYSAVSEGETDGMIQLSFKGMLPLWLSYLYNQLLDVDLQMSLANYRVAKPYEVPNLDHTVYVYDE